MPGEEFSYNQAVGQRTRAAGFREAGAYSNGKVVQELVVVSARFHQLYIMQYYMQT